MTRPLILLALLITVTFTLWTRGHHGPHVLQPTVFPGTKTSRSTPVRNVCQRHNFKSFSNPRKVYDLFLISTELDWLEIRLNTLAPYVDYFVIVESSTTFTGRPKPLYLKDNWQRFERFHSQIIHRIVEDPGVVVGTRTWDHEDYMRNALFDHVFPSLVHTAQEAKLHDVLVVSDIDEIPRPETMDLLRYCNFPTRLTLNTQFFYYSFQWRHRGEEWAHPQATIFRGLERTILPKDLRNGEGDVGWLYLGYLRTWWEKADLWNAGWHCSSCFKTLDETRTKMQSFSHVGWNTEQNRDQATLLERVRTGQDLFGRPAEIYDRVEQNQDVPSHVLGNEDRFSYMLSRDGANAGFADV